MIVSINAKVFDTETAFIIESGVFRVPSGDSVQESIDDPAMASATE
jgi:hypothetical protein